MSDEQKSLILIFVSLIGFFLAGLKLGVWSTKRQYQYGCAPDVLRSYTEGYQDCKAGK